MARATVLVGLSAALLALLVPTVRAEESDKAAEARKAFDSLYGSDLKRVRATPAAKDDVELAGRLLATAKEAAGQPEFLAILCEKVCELASAAPEGYAVAIEALELEAAKVPDRAAACSERILDLRQKQFDSAKAGERSAPGEALLNLLLAAADAREEAAAWLEASALAKRAQAVARAISSKRQAEIDARAAALAQALKTARDIEAVRTLLAKDPQNAGLREKLVRLHLVDLDDPGAAANLLEGVKDESLRKFVPAAAKPVEEVPELACLELGDWYRGFGETAPAAAKAGMFARAQGYYQRYLALHTTEDLDRVKAGAALQKVEAELQAAGAARPPPRPKPAAPGKAGPAAGPIDILAVVDPDTDAVSGSCARQGSALAIKGRTMVPLVVDGSYELTVKFMRTGGGDTVGIILPVGAKTVLLGLGYYGNIAHGLDQVNGKNGCDPANPTVVRPAGLQNNREYSAHAKVLVEGNQAEISVDLDGKPIINWRGAPSAFTMYEGWRLPQPKRLGLGASNGSALFLSAQLTMLSGQARLARPGQESAVSPAPPAKATGPGQVIDLLRLVDPAKHAIRGKMEREGLGWAISCGVNTGRIAIPVEPQGSYELQVRFVRTDGKEFVGVVLPVGETAVVLKLGDTHGEYSGLEYVNGKGCAENATTVMPGTLQNNHEYPLGVKVMVEGDQAEVVATLDGKPYIHWRGPQSALSGRDIWGGVRARSLGLGTRESTVLWRSAQLRMLSGEAKIRPSAADDPASGFLR